MPAVPAVVRQLIDRCHAGGIRTDEWWLVGGVLRDTLLGTLGDADIDIAIVGDPRQLAPQLLNLLEGVELLAEHRFGTVSLRWQDYHIDIAMVRSETYSAPGALPAVLPAQTIEEDLWRRDFGVNALALNLRTVQESFELSQLVDPCGGITDITARKIRVLHDKSFVDDPTRLVRACRYAARLDFSLDAHTHSLAVDCVDEGGLETISADRLGRELRLACGEHRSGRALQLLSQLKIVQTSSERFNRSLGIPWQVASSLLDPADQAVIVAGLTHVEASLQRRVVRAVEAVLRGDLANYSTDPSMWLCLADPICKDIPDTLLAGIAQLADADTASLVEQYRSRRPHAAPLLNGDDVIDRGVPPGPAVGVILGLLRTQRLTGAIDTLDEEVAYVQELIAAGL